MNTLEERVNQLHMRLFALEREMEKIKEKDIFYYTWNSAEKTMVYTKPDLGGNDD